MKWILTAFIALSMNEAFAGGQTGSGMNGCWVRNGLIGTQWRSIEEINYPHMIIRRPVPASRPYINQDVRLQIPNKPYVNLNTKTYSMKALRRMKRLQASHPRSHKLFIELFKLFDHVQVTNVKVRGLFRGDISRPHAQCRDFLPAMLTYNDGAIVVSRPVFEKLDGLSAEILYIHESIRFAQSFHPAFKDLEDRELQLLTSMFFLNKTSPSQFKAILGKYETRLEQAAYKKEPAPIVFEDGKYDTEVVFRHKFQEALYHDEGNIGTALNDLRMNDVEFKTHSYEQIVKLLKSANH